MARQQQIGDSEDWFLGEDKTLEFEIYNASGTIQDVTGWSLAWYVRTMGDSDKKILTKATGGSGVTITGSYNSDPDTNTQRVGVAVADTDIENFQPGKYQHALWRTDAGNETVLSYGTLTWKKADRRALHVVWRVE